ncbi:MAG: peptidyl-prolyl cis-trans isomerase [Candidatus Krumholzibacteriia bacterium]
MSRRPLSRHAAPTTRPWSVGRGPAALLAAGLLLAALLIAGCGDKDKSSEDFVVAQVGERTITAQDYGLALQSTPENELPADEFGRRIDTGTVAGKQAFLESLVNREVQVQKASRLGYDRDSEIAGAGDYLRSYHAVEIMREDLVTGPADFVSNAEADAYYANVGKARRLKYMICDLRSDAEMARQHLLAGEPWDDVADQFRTSDHTPQRKNEITVQWGRMEDPFERVIFSLKPEQISEPVETVYGYWLVKLLAENQTERPPLDQIRLQVLDSVRKQKTDLGQHDVLEQIRRDHELKVDEQKLLLVHAHLPREDDGDGADRDGVPRARELEVPATMLADTLITYRFDDAVRLVTVGDLKALYDGAARDGQPTAEKTTFGKLRRWVLQGVDKSLLLDEARLRGYLDDPRTIHRTRWIVDDMMVKKLQRELVSVSERVSEEDVDAYWAAHQDELVTAEVRTGYAVPYRDEQTARRAYEELVGGRPWRDVAADNGNVRRPEIQADGQLGPLLETSDNPLREVLFALAPEEVAPPVERQGIWWVVGCEEIRPSRPLELDAAREAIGTRVVNQRRERALQDLLQKWRDEVGVTVHEDRLADLPSREELVKPDGAGDAVI